MKQLAMAALLLASTAGLGGCMISIGSTEATGTDRTERLEQRMDKAEKTLGIQEGAKQ